MNSLGLLPHHSCPAQSSSTPHPWPSQLREGKEGCISYSKQILLPWIPSPLDALRNFIPESPLLSQESSVNHFLPSALPSHLHPHLFLHFSAVMRPYTLRTSSGSSPLLHLWFRWSASLVDVAPPFFLLFRATPVAYGGSQARGWIRATATRAQPQQLGNQAASATYTTAHSNAGSLTHWARPGIEPASSWILIRLVSTAPQQELPARIFSVTTA